MSADANNPADLLTEDTLLLVFNRLDATDLRNCETVCRQWQRVIRAGTPWKKFCQRQVKCDPLWKRIWERLKLDEKKLRVEHYRNICRAMFQAEQELDSNWRTGNYEKREDPLGDTFDSYKLDSFNEYFLYKDASGGKKIFDVQSRTFIDNIRVPERGHVLSVRKDRVVIWDYGENKVEILERETGRLKGQLIQRDHIVSAVALDDTFVTVTSEADAKSRLTLWNIDQCSEFEYLNHLTFESYSYFHFTAHHIIYYTRTHENNRFKAETIYVVRMKSMQIETSLSIRSTRLHHSHQGIILFSVSPGRIRVLDVIRGSFLCDINAPATKGPRIFDNGSNYLAIVERSGECNEVYIYDWKAIMNHQMQPDCFLQLTVTTKCIVHWTHVALNLMYFISSDADGREKTLTTIDFGVYENFQCLSPENLQIT